MSKASWFPVWLPYPKSWMMAMKLAIPAYFGATVVFAFEFWRYFLVGSLLAVTGNNNLILFFVVSVIALLLAFIWFLILAGGYALLLRFLWSNPPKWLTLPKFRSLIIRDFVILVLSLLPIVTLFIIPIYILSVSSLQQRFGDVRTFRVTLDVFLLRFWWIWLISAAYLYQWSNKEKF
ncbi:hypothetical protein [Nostoc sp. PCC 7107]|uniref:hypothetical protein n=1 Tax=Nostoc sp. PCC 7107 TaxID=317936 RepID=UPI00029EDB27|nr:hypothetical protein [Nostoc sp. PCC 7107]AFY45218.1 hypothetical protein Nos7107_4693 [Nostoc sp. PCC 7107]